LTDLIKKETSLLTGLLQASHIDSKQKEQFDSKLSDKIGWRGFNGYVADKEAKKFTTVWPTDDEWLKLNDDELDQTNLTHIHCNEGVNVESLTFQLNNKFEIMQHPVENNYTKKTAREIDGRHIRKIEMVARKNKQMIASIKFLDAENNVVCSL
jgi:hypothetical protein